ncbi:LysR family transcriptional regulator [Phenylobacterium sp.]|uniref:LysR family transcriptional regulator n=1 Tax=Phenylobacterium sp. TaxID=1871053 RepID=UPI002731034A|nr:LysR family transcriptional regulator [Phenylobacterium sp.]MDP1619257.1 LysR family transcriptional regulator [Phenylobacterium sp.]MDP1989119.1 LysR family transcriptional regulator [Phenylobacterium sp.]
MDLVWLEDFLALAEHRNFSRAAEVRNISQPAFSRRVRMLEDWLGAPLFDRDTQRVDLTAAGAEFLPVAQEVLRRVTFGRERVQEVSAAAASSLRIACTNVLSLTFFPDWLQRLETSADLSPSNVSLVTDSMADCERLMVAGQAQFMLSHHHPAAHTALETGAFRALDIGADVLIPVSAPSGPQGGAPLHALPGSAAAPTAFLGFNPASGMGRIVAATRANEAPPTWLRPVFTAQLAMVLLIMAREGRGMAWLPLSLVSRDLAAGTLVRSAASDAWDIPVTIRLHRPHARQSPSAEAFWATATNRAAMSA